MTYVMLDENITNEIRSSRKAVVKSIPKHPHL